MQKKPCGWILCRALALVGFGAVLAGLNVAHAEEKLVLMTWACKGLVGLNPTPSAKAYTEQRPASPTYNPATEMRRSFGTILGQSEAANASAHTSCRRAQSLRRRDNRHVQGQTGCQQITVACNQE